MTTKKQKSKVRVLSVFTAIVLAAAVFVAAGTWLRPMMAYAAPADPTHIAVTYYDGPYTRGFTWQTATGVTEGKVQIVEKTGTMTKSTVDWSAATEAPAASASAAYNDGTFLSWKASHDFTPAAAGKTYFYRLGSEGAWSPVGEQKIIANEGGVSMVHVSDPQGRNAGVYNLWVDTLNAAKQTLPDMQNFLFTGDFMQDPKQNVQWGYALDMPKTVLMDTVIMPSQGNHDGGGGGYGQQSHINARFNIKMADGAGDKFYYSYTIGEVHVACINTNNPNTSGNLDAAMINWLKTDLAAAKDNPAVRWTVVIQHSPVFGFGQYSAGTDQSGTPAKAGIDAQRALLMPIYCQNEVDLVLQGHEHNYARSVPVAWDADVPDWKNPGGAAAATGFETKTYGCFGVNRKYFEKPDGTVYVDIGPAGGSRRMDLRSVPALNDLLGTVPEGCANAGEKANLQPENPTWEDYGQKGMFGAIRIVNEVLLYETYSVDGGTPILIDYFGIDKDPTAAKPDPVEIPDPSNPVTGISITTPPAKTAYKIGEAADWTGMVVTATKKDNSTVTLTAANCTVTGFDSSTVGTKTITVMYQEKTAEFTVTVEEKKEESGGGGCACGAISVADGGGLFLTFGVVAAAASLLYFAGRKKLKPHAAGS